MEEEKFSKLKIIISTVLIAVIVFPLAFFIVRDVNKRSLTGFLYEKTEDGKFVYFGEYPQSLKSDEVTIEPNTNNNGYYIGSDGEKYVKHIVDVNFSSIGVSGQDIYNFNFLNTKTGLEMQQGQEYFFKVEKLKWRILQEQNRKALLVCDNIINNIPFQLNYKYDEETSKYYITNDDGNILVDGNGEKLYANNYQYSNLRKFLNKDFYEKAFNSRQKNIINLENVDNSAYTTNNLINIYASKNTKDRIFTLSYADVTNLNYGFLSSVDEIDNNKKWFATDYAKATGAFTLTKEFLDSKFDFWQVDAARKYNKLLRLIGTGCSLLRSPCSETSFEINSIAAGAIYKNNISYFSVSGIVPALIIQI